MILSLTVFVEFKKQNVIRVSLRLITKRPLRRRLTPVRFTNSQTGGRGKFADIIVDVSPVDEDSGKRWPAIYQQG